MGQSGSPRGGGKTPFFARWTFDWDCLEETQFYYCIKDDGFDIMGQKAKIRYEINKGRKNFVTRIIDPEQFSDELYQVYVDSLKGYPDGTSMLSKDSFENLTSTAWKQDACRFFGTFDRESGRLCGYSDVYERGKFLPISSLHVRPNFEKLGVNLALVDGIVEWYLGLKTEGKYLCDGARNTVHATNFQSFLIKYFGFRKAYCKLNIVYRPPINVLITVLFPIRHLLGKMNDSRIKKIYYVLKMEAWKRGMPD